MAGRIRIQRIHTPGRIRVTDMRSPVTRSRLISQIQHVSPFFDQSPEDERKKMVEMLVGAGADVNKPDLHDYTPLHMACMWGWADTDGRVLLIHGRLRRAPPAHNPCLARADQERSE